MPQVHPILPEGQPDEAAKEEKKAVNSLRRRLVPLTISFSVVVIALQVGLWYTWYNMAIDAVSLPSASSVATHAARASLTAAEVLQPARLSVKSLALAAQTDEITDLQVQAAVTDTSVGSLSSLSTQSLSSACGLSAYLVGIVEVSRDLQWLGIGFEDGTIYAARRSGDQIYARIVDKQNVLGQGTRLRDYLVDPSTGCFDLNQFVEGSEAEYDPTSRPWYTSTKQEGAPGWGSGVYAGFSTGGPVISATQPLYAADGTTLLGVIAADCALSQISAILLRIKPAKSGQTFLLENLDGVDYVIGSSSGNVSTETNERLPATEHSCSVVTELYEFLINSDKTRNSTTDSLKTAANYTFSGHPLISGFYVGEPMVSVVPFVEETGTLNWHSVSGNPEDDFYAFVVFNSWCMFVWGLVLVSVLGWFIHLSVVNPYHTLKKSHRILISTVLVGSIFQALWIISTKEATVEAVEYALSAFMIMFSEMVETRISQMIHQNFMTSMSYQAGALLLGAVDAASDTSIDRHLGNSLTLHPTMASAYIGWSNGDVSGLRKECMYSLCEEPTNALPVITQFTRSLLTTSSTLIRFQTSAAASGVTRDSSSILTNEGTYNANEEICYKLAAATVRESTSSRYGVPVLSPVFVTAIGGMMVSSCQGFYSDSGEMLGVVGFDTSLEFISQFLAARPITRGTRGQIIHSDMVAVENLGEIIGSSSFETIYPTSSGGMNRVNVTTTASPNLKDAVLNILDKYGDFVKSQNHTEFSAAFSETSSSMSSWQSPYPTLSASLSEWTFLTVFPREAYFGTLDDESDKTFSILVFSFTALSYMFAVLFSYQTHGDPGKDMWSFDSRMISNLMESAVLTEFRGDACDACEDHKTKSHSRRASLGLESHSPCTESISRNKSTIGLDIDMPSSKDNDTMVQRKLRLAQKHAKEDGERERKHDAQAERTAEKLASLGAPSSMEKIVSGIEGKSDSGSGKGSGGMEIDIERMGSGLAAADELAADPPKRVISSIANALHQEPVSPSPCLPSLLHDINANRDDLNANRDQCEPCEQVEQHSQFSQANSSQVNNWFRHIEVLDAKVDLTRVEHKPQASVRHGLKQGGWYCMCQDVSFTGQLHADQEAKSDKLSDSQQLPEPAAHRSINSISLSRDDLSLSLKEVSMPFSPINRLQRQDTGLTELEEEELEEEGVRRCTCCTWERTDLIKLAKDHSRTHEFLAATRLRLEPMIARLELESPDSNMYARHQYMKSKAAGYLCMMRDGRDVFQTMCLEAKFGTSSWQVCLFNAYDTWYFTTVHHLLLFLFILCEFIPYGQPRVLVDLFFMCFFTIDTAMQIWSCYHVHGVRLDSQTLFSSSGGVFLISTFLWICLLLEAFLGIDQVIGMSRPVMMITKARIVQSTLKVLLKCIQKSAVIFALLFAAVAVAGMLAMLLYESKFDGSVGHTVDTFFDSFVYMFVFLTSGENWDVLVYPGLGVSKASAIFFFPMAVVGILFLMSMVVAKFETVYKSTKGILTENKRVQHRVALAATFILGTWAQEEEFIQDRVLEKAAFTDLMDQYWREADLDFGSMLDIINAQADAPGAFTNHGLAMMHGSPKSQQATGRSPRQQARLSRRGSTVDTIGNVFIPMIFNTMDVDRSSSIDFSEFESVVAISKCIEIIKDDVLLAYKTMASRIELLLTEDKEKLHLVPKWDVNKREVLLVNITRHYEVFDRTKAAMNKCISDVHQKVDITSWFTMEMLDATAMLAVILNMACLSVYNTFESNAWIDWAGNCFAIFYALEMGLRVYIAGSWKNFITDPRGRQYSFQNKFTIALCVIVFVAMISLYALGDRSDAAKRVLKTLRAAQLFRIFLINPSFRDIIFSFSQGLQAVGSFFLVLFIIFYVFSYSGYLIFNDITMPKYQKFDSLLDSMLTMFQLFVGEGWHSIMIHAVDQTNKILVWFFVLYFVITGVLFTNLFMGIIINIFQNGEEKRSTFSGQVKLAFMTPCRDMDKLQQETLLKELGRLSAMLYDHSLRHFADLRKFQESIDRFFQAAHWYSPLDVECPVFTASEVIAEPQELCSHRSRNSRECAGDEQWWAVTRMAESFRAGQVRRYFSGYTTFMHALKDIGWENRDVVSKIYAGYKKVSGVLASRAITTKTDLLQVVQGICEGFCTCCARPWHMEGTWRVVTSRESRYVKWIDAAEVQVLERHLAAPGAAPSPQTDKLVPVSFALGGLSHEAAHCNGTYKQSGKLVNGLPVFRLLDSDVFCCCSKTGEWWLQSEADKGNGAGWAKCVGFLPTCKCNNQQVVHHVTQRLNQLLNELHLKTIKNMACDLGRDGDTWTRISKDTLRCPWPLLKVSAYTLEEIVKANAEVHDAINPYVNQWKAAERSGRAVSLMRRSARSFNVLDSPGVVSAAQSPRQAPSEFELETPTRQRVHKKFDSVFQRTLSDDFVNGDV